MKLQPKFCRSLAVTVWFVSVTLAVCQPALVKDRQLAPFGRLEEFVLYAAVIQPDGKMIVAGEQTTDPAGRRLLRFDRDGNVDLDFKPELGAMEVRILSIHGTGLLLSGLAYDTPASAPTASLIRLSSDGSLDRGFHVVLRSENPLAPLESIVVSASVQPDGKILIAGSFSRVNDFPRSSLARLDKDGTVDENFLPALTLAECQAVLSQADGKVLVAGRMTGTHSSVVRLNQDGSLDTSFLPPSLDRDEYAPGAGDGFVCGLGIQPDGRILIGGGFQFVNGMTRNTFARLMPDGSLDASFAPPPKRFGGLRLLPTRVHFALERSGAILAAYDGAGLFEPPRRFHRILRLMSNGSFDPMFDSATFGGQILVVTASGEVVVNEDYPMRLVLLRPAPVLRSTQITDGTLTMRIGGQPGWLYRVETSPDLVNWSLARELPGSGAVTEFTDLERGDALTRFYRVGSR